LKFRKDVFPRVTGLLFVVQRRIMPRRLGGSASYSRTDRAAGEKDDVSTPAIICLYSPQQGSSQAGDGCNQNRIISLQSGRTATVPPSEHQRDSSE
jgi:hypothetical protein